MGLFGYRYDAKRVRDVNSLSQICIDLKPNRCDSYVYINQNMDVTNLDKFIKKKKDEGINITYFHAFLSALGVTFYNRPKLNRFVANRHIYEHNDMIFSFVAKTSFNDKSDEIMIMIPMKKNDNIYSISEKVRKKVDSTRNGSHKKEGANIAIDTLAKLPNIIRVPVMWMFKRFDSIGILPKSLVKDNLYYSSLIVSNLGAIKCGAIHHNITNFGTCSGLVTMGEVHDEEFIINGKETVRKVCEMGICLDERIADGYYFAKSVNLLQYVLDNPSLLEDDIGKKLNIEEIR